MEIYVLIYLIMCTVFMKRSLNYGTADESDDASNISIMNNSGTFASVF